MLPIENCPVKERAGSFAGSALLSASIYVHIYLLPPQPTAGSFWALTSLLVKQQSRPVHSLNYVC